MRTASEALSQALIPIATTVTAIGVMAVAIYLLRSWLRENDGPAASEYELLAEYREMHRRGELSDEEFRIIKGQTAPRPRRPSDSLRQKEPEEKQARDADRVDSAGPPASTSTHEAES